MQNKHIFHQFRWGCIVAFSSSQTLKEKQLFWLRSPNCCAAQTSGELLTAAPDTEAPDSEWLRGIHKRGLLMGAPDSDWLRRIHERGLLMVAPDSDWLRRTHERGLLMVAPDSVIARATPDSENWTDTQTIQGDGACKLHPPTPRRRALNA